MNLFKVRNRIFILFFLNLVFLSYSLCIFVEFENSFSTTTESKSILTIPIILSEPSSVTVTVKYIVSGGEAYNYNSASGRDHNLSFGEIVFLPFETRKNISVNILNDDIAETDESIEIMLIDPVNADFRYKSNIKYILKIIDDDRSCLIDVKNLDPMISSVCAKGDGKTDDTYAIQKAIDFAYSLSTTTGKCGVIYFSTGTYLVTKIFLKDGLVLSGYGAIIKRPKTNGVFMRTFNCTYSGVVDSKPLIFKGFTVDGNSANQIVDNEHVSLLFACGDKSYPGKLNLFIEDCFFKDNIADGVTIYRNVNSNIYNCSFSNLRRSGILMDGGYSVLKSKNITLIGLEDKPSLEIEMSGDGIGYGNTFSIEGFFDDIVINNGWFDFSIPYFSTITINKMFVSPHWYLRAPHSNVNFSNCKIILPSANMQQVSNTVFNRCEFVASDRGLNENTSTLKTAFLSAWNGSGTNDIENGRLIFSSCKFSLDRNNLGSKIISVFMNVDEDIRKQNYLILDRCIISENIDEGVHLHQGGNLFIKDTIIKAKKPIRWAGLFTTQSFFSSITINGLLVQSSYYMDFFDSSGDFLLHEKVMVDEKANIITSNYTTISDSIFHGGRIIIGMSSPTSKTNGFIGDIYRIKYPIPNKVHEWVCVKSGYYVDSFYVPKGTSTLVSSKWEPLPLIDAIAYVETFPNDNPIRKLPAEFYVKGNDITHYKYKLDNGVFGSTFTVLEPLTLGNLTNGAHVVELIGKNSLGIWQPESRATRYIWFINVDTVPPVGIVRINNGDNICFSKEVVLNLSALDESDVVEMKLSNFPDFDTAISEPFCEEKNWKLLGGTGMQTIYVWFKDMYGNWTEKDCPATDHIYLSYVDNEGPVIYDLKAHFHTNQILEVSWKTDEPSTSQVAWGCINLLTNETIFDPILTTSHSCIIQLNERSSVYYFSAKSIDIHGNETVSKVESISLLSNIRDRNFSSIKVYPNPVKLNFNNGSSVKFINIPIETNIKIFSVDGSLIRQISSKDFGENGFILWDMKDENGNLVDKGIYFYIISDKFGNMKKGKISIIK